MKTFIPGVNVPPMIPISGYSTTTFPTQGVFCTTTARIRKLTEDEQAIDAFYDFLSEYQSDIRSLNERLVELRRIREQAPTRSSLIQKLLWRI